jgi:NADP-dependent 3-hydroxy acid dehydrogenase YdfG
VTGASSGFGEAIARRLAARGWRCLLLARREDRLQALAGELGAEYAVCDVSDRARVEEVAAGHPRVSLLVNNAGIPAGGDFLTADPERIETAMRVNYLGSVWCLRAFLPALEAARPSDVVNMVSVAGAVSYPPSGPYGATKHAQLAFSRAVATQLRPRGIRVHSILPGFAVTDGFPQTDLLANPLTRRLMVGVDAVADTVIDALDRDRAEVVVPWWYRPIPVLQALAPGLMTGGLAARLYGRLRQF